MASNFLSGEAEPTHLKAIQDRFLISINDISSSKNEENEGQNNPPKLKNYSPLVQEVDDNLSEHSTTAVQRKNCYDCIYAKDNELGKMEGKKATLHLDETLNVEEDSPPPLLEYNNGSETLVGGNNTMTNGIGKENDACTSHLTPPMTSLMDQMMEDATEATEIANKKKVQKEREKSKNSFLGSGFGKGFLSKSKQNRKPKALLSTAKKNQNSNRESSSLRRVVGKKVTEQSSDNAIPMLTKRADDTTTDNLVLEDVQDRMSKLFPYRTNEWATPELIEQIRTNPRLMTGMSNAKFTALMEKLENDPKKGILQLNEHPEFKDFMKEMLAVMGNHFTLLGEQEQQRTKNKQGKKYYGPFVERAVNERSNQNPELARVKHNKNGAQKENDLYIEGKVQNIIENKELTSILMDPECQQIMEECGTPGRMQKYLHDPLWGPKLKLLIEAGLLQFV